MRCALGPRATRALIAGQNRRVFDDAPVPDPTAPLSVIESTPFVEIPRADWAALAPLTGQRLTAADLESVRGLGDRLNVDEVDDIYRPLSRLLWLYAHGARELHSATNGFLQRRASTTPFVIGVAGSVAVGKSTVSRLLQFLLARWEETPNVALVTTD